MKIKYIALITTIFLLITPEANAKVICDNKGILRVKNDANKVTIEHEISKNADLNGMFNLKISGLTEDMSIVETSTDKRYTTNYTEDGIVIIPNVQGNNFVFKLYYDRCSSTLVRTIKYKLPKYNYYSENELCEGITEEELAICGKWYQGDLNEESFKKQIEDYKKSLEQKKEQEKKENTIFKQIINFLLDYYIYIIATIVVIVVITIAIMVRKKRYSLE